MRVAVVGIGGIGRVHVEHLGRAKEAQVVAIADLDQVRASKVQTDYKVPKAYADYREMMDKEKPEGVFICTPPSVHLDPVKAAAERGIAVFLEKPLDVKLQDAKKAVRLCKAAGIVNQMGYHWRFNDGRVEARSILLEKGGTIGMVEGKWWGGVYNVPWWIRRESSGGQITEQTTHIFDQCRWLAGDVSKVQALLATRINTDRENYNLDDVSAVLLSFKSGAIGVVTSTNAAVEGEEGVKVIAQHVKYEDYASRVVIKWRDHQAEFTGKRSPYLAEEEAFMSCVKAGRPTSVDLEEGLKSLELSLGAIASSERGRPVALPL
jgi:predicted dehydrogenase